MALRFRILAGTERPRSLVVDPGEASAPAEDRAFEIATDLGEVRLGRQPGVEIELPFGAVSTVHARITRGQTPGEWWIEDLDSTNGTWLDGVRLPPRQPRLLRGGQRLRIATVDLVFEGWSAAPTGSEGTGSMARRLISDLFGASGAESPALIVESGTAHPARLPLVERDRRYRVGRGDDGDLVLIGDAVSRDHAVFVRRWDGVTAIDLGSRNGVLVNGTATSGEHHLSDGDRITIGPVTLRLADPEDRHLRRLRELADGSAPSRPRLPGAHQDAAMGARSLRPTPLASAALYHPVVSWSRRLMTVAAVVVALAALAGLAFLLLAA